MYACYIDESGHCGERFDPNQPVEVLCGVITDMTKLFKTQREQDQILSLLDKAGIPTSELKGKEIYRGKNSWYKVEPKVRHHVINLLIEWAIERKCKFVVSPIDTKKFFARKEGGCERSRRLFFPYETGALHIILAIQRMKSGSKNNKGKTIIVFDEQNSHDDRILKILENDLSFTDGFTGYEMSKKKNHPPRLSEIVDVPHFSKSHLSKMIQIADLVGFIVNRYLLLRVYGKNESYENELATIEVWYRKIGECLIPARDLDPPSKDDFSEMLRDVRPDGWSPKKWLV